MAEKIVIAKLDLDSSELVKSATQTKNAINQLKQAQKELDTTTEEGAKQYVKNEAQLKKLSSEYRTQSNAISQLITSNGELLKTEEALSIAIDKDTKSITDARANIAELTKVRNELNLKTKEGQDALVLINAKIDENNNFIKTNASELEKQKMNVGNYTESIKDALANINPLNGGLAGFAERSKEAGGVGNLLTTSLKSMATGIAGVTRASLAFLATPIGAVIGAIGLVLGGLITYLKSTQAGIDAVTSVTRPLQAVFQSLLGVVQQVGKFIFDAFSNPQKVIKPLSDLIQEQLINRFVALKDIVVGLFTFDPAQIKKGVNDLADANGKLIDRVKTAGSETAKFFQDAIDKGRQIDNLTKQIEKSEINLNKERALSEVQQEKLRLISRDTSKNINERAKAQAEIVKLATEEAEKEANILKLKIQRLKVQQSLNDTSREGNKELADLEAELIKVQNKGVQAELEGIRVTAQLRKEQQAEARERQQKAEADRQKKIDNLIKDLELEKQIFEERNRIESQSLAFKQSVYTKDLTILQTQLKNKLISEKQFALEKLKLDNELKDFEEQEREKQLQRIGDFENRKRSLEENLRLAKQQDDKAREELKAQFDFEKQVAELEKLQLDEAQKTELLKLIEEQRGLVLQDIRDKFNQANFEKQKAVGEAILNNRMAQANEEIAIVKQVTGMLTGLLGDSLGAQLAGIAIQAAIEAGLVKIATSSAIARNTAQATASAPPPFNIANILLATGQNSKLLAQSSISISKIISSAALSGLGQVISSKGKFEQGGMMEIGGKRHSSGGTKFYGEDGTRFEAEKGELIGVLNRSASDAFMNFNNAYANGSRSTSFAQNGGFIARATQSNDIETIAMMTIEMMKNIPAPIVTVEDINTVATRVNVIESNATF